jgi:hypothetical protein
VAGVVSQFDYSAVGPSRRVCFAVLYPFVVVNVMRVAFQENHRLTKSSESHKERSAIAGGDGSGQLLVAEESLSLTREVEPELVYAPFNPPKNLRRLLILLQ